MDRPPRFGAVIAHTERPRGNAPFRNVRFQSFTRSAKTPKNDFESRSQRLLVETGSTVR